jgi:hypothetical protein
MRPPHKDRKSVSSTGERKLSSRARCGRENGALAPLTAGDLESDLASGKCCVDRLRPPNNGPDFEKKKPHPGTRRPWGSISKR